MSDPIRRQRRISIPFDVFLMIGDRDGWRCQLRSCGEGFKPGPEWDWEVDHDDPYSEAVFTNPLGVHAVNNLRLMHAQCNREKGAA